ncbi:MAG: riboflavin biosynthesis protein RibF [Clostridia bacterium]|nr:riboflavin biosynthesis protein RibF [Clostridia bacterium]
MSVKSDHPRFVLLDLHTRPFRRLEADALAAGTVMCLGNFDGVHLAHQSILREGTRLSRLALNGSLCGVFCFFRPSADFLRSRKAASADHLSTLREKLEAFADCGADFVCLCDFREVRRRTPGGFIRLLKTRLNCRGVVCGFNYRFGVRGAGTPDLLRDAFPVPDTLGASVLPEMTVSLPDGTSGSVTVSSSRIREALAEGRPEAAAAMLGRPYALRTRVVPGKRLGRTIGFPTANQYFPPERLIPKKGVYAVRVTTPDGVFPGVADVGSHPTVDKRARVNCETHVLGYSGDLYGHRIKVEFLRFIRPEQKFDSLDELTAAIRRDADTAEKLLRERI